MDVECSIIMQVWRSSTVCSC